MLNIILGAVLGVALMLVLNWICDRVVAAKDLEDVKDS